MALEHMFKKDGLRENEGDIVVPKTTLEKLRQYRFAYIAEKAIQEGGASERIVRTVGKSALELAMGDMGLYNPHTLPTVYSSFDNPEAIAKTTVNYSKYFKEAYESATVGDLLTLFGEAGVEDQISAVKLKRYANLTLTQLDESVKKYQDSLNEEGKKGKEMDEKAVNSANLNIALAVESAKLLANLKQNYEMVLMETARKRASDEAFENNYRSRMGIIRGPDMKDLGHHL